MAFIFLRTVCLGLVAAVLVYGFLVLFYSGKAPQSTESYEYYDVDALQGRALKQQFSERGPDGFAAVAIWRVEWNMFCKIKVHTQFIFPKHTKYQSLSDLQQKEWDRFMNALRLHERTHQYHGVLAAKEAAASFCVNASAIIRFWGLKDEIFDLKTGHGTQSGAVLRM